MPELVLCAACGRRLSRPVVRLAEVPEPRRREGERNGHDYDPTLAEGAYAVDPFPLATTTESDKVTSVGCLVLNPSDVHALRDHPDLRRLSGCCGRDGLDGPNQVCRHCGAEVATLRDDCWSPVEVRFEPSAVKVVRWYG